MILYTDKSTYILLIIYNLIIYILIYQCRYQHINAEYVWTFS